MFKDRNENYRLKIAFDFDGTLTDSLFYALAERLILKGHDVWIMTARLKTQPYELYDEVPESERNNDIVEVAQKLGIPQKIIYTNLESKKGIFLEQGFDLLFDDECEWHCNPICEAGKIAVNI